MDTSRWLSWDAMSRSRGEINLGANESDEWIELQSYENLTEDEIESMKPFHGLENQSLKSVGEVEGLDAINFEVNGDGHGHAAPTDKYVHPPRKNAQSPKMDDPSQDYPKMEFAHLFEHSACASFFAYAPVAFWSNVVIETNCNLRNLKKEDMELNKSKVVKKTRFQVVKEFNLDEFMKFLGILFFMELEGNQEYF